MFFYNKLGKLTSVSTVALLALHTLFPFGATHAAPRVEEEASEARVSEIASLINPGTSEEPQTVSADEALYSFLEKLPGKPFEGEIVENFNELPPDHLFQPGDYIVPMSATRVENAGPRTDLPIPIILDGNGRWTKRSDNLYMRVVFSRDSSGLALLLFRVVCNPENQRMYVGCANPLGNDATQKETLVASADPRIAAAPMLSETVAIRKDTLTFYMENARVVLIPELGGGDLHFGDLQEMSEALALAPAIPVVAGGVLVVGVVIVSLWFLDIQPELQKALSQAMLDIGPALVDVAVQPSHLLPAFGDLEDIMTWPPAIANNDDYINVENDDKNQSPKPIPIPGPVPTERDKEKMECSLNRYRQQKMIPVVTTWTLCIGLSRTQTSNGNRKTEDYIRFEEIVEDSLGSMPGRLEVKYGTILQNGWTFLQMNFGVFQVPGNQPMPAAAAEYAEQLNLKNTMVEFDSYNIETRTIIDAKCWGYYGSMNQGGLNSGWATGSMARQMMAALRAKEAVGGSLDIREIVWVFPSDAVKNNMQSWYDSIPAELEGGVDNPIYGLKDAFINAGLVFRLESYKGSEQVPQSCQ